MERRQAQDAHDGGDQIDLGQRSVVNSQPSFYNRDDSDSMSGDSNCNPDNSDDFNMGDAGPTILYLMKASSDQTLMMFPSYSGINSSTLTWGV